MNMQSILSEIVEYKRNEVDLRKENCPLASLQAVVRPGAGSFLPSISSSGIRLIAEIKPKSPSAGQLSAGVDLDGLAATYSKRAAAISVLTDSEYFGGSLDALRSVSSIATIPTLCKDFILDEYQVVEARVYGAEAVLLIAKILDSVTLANLYKRIKSLHMVPVVEVQNEAELAIALTLNPEVVLINNRNLDTFEIDLTTTERLARLIPSTTKVVSASGIENKDDILRLRKHTNIFLVGSSLMRSLDIEAKLEELCNPFLVKTCGITSAIDASAALSLGADLIGIIFAQSSHRRVSFDQAKYICQAVGGERVVAVFQDQPLAEIQELQQSLGFKYVQLHGDESPDMVQALKPCIKAITIDDADSIKSSSTFIDAADYLLFDRPKMITGTPLEWIDRAVKLLKAQKPKGNYLFAGGLVPSNVRAVVDSIADDHLVGVDVASGIEVAPGVKDLRLVQQFIMEAKRNAVAR